jgi:hypothetical protein
MGLRVAEKKEGGFGKVEKKVRKVREFSHDKKKRRAPRGKKVGG